MTRLDEVIRELHDEAKRRHFDRMAINFAVSTYRTYFEIKLAFKNIFGNSNTSISFFTGTLIEIFDIEEINAILETYHSSILGGHRGFGRMKNTIKQFYVWPSMNADIKKFINNCPV